MSWTNAFAGFAIFAIVIGIAWGTGQAFAMPSDPGIGHMGLTDLIHGHLNENLKAPREIPPMRPIPTIFPVPDHEKKMQLVEGYTDKTTYAPGDKVTGSVVLKNIGNVTVDDVTIHVSAYKQTPMGFVYVGSKTESLNGLKITPGMVKKLDRHVTIPKKFSNSLIAGDYRLDVTVFAGAVQVGSFTTYVTIK